MRGPLRCLLGPGWKNVSTSSIDHRRPDRHGSAATEAGWVASAIGLAKELKALAPDGPAGQNVRDAIERFADQPPAQQILQLPGTFLEVARELGAGKPRPGEVLEMLRELVRERHAELLQIPAFAQVIEADQRRSGMLAWLLRENVDRLERTHQELAARETELDSVRRDRDQLEAERRALAREVDHLRPLADAGLLAAGISHDLKNTLQALAGHADMARAALPPTAEPAQHLRKAILASEHAAELSRRIVQWAGAERGSPEPSSLSTLTAEVIDLVAPGVPPNVRVQVSLADELPLILVDPTDLRRIILNLMVNAWQAIGERDGVIRVTTGIHDGREPGAWLEVGDDGSGMDGETRDRLFEPFYSAHGGCGLGLATVRTLVERQGGTIEVWSEPAHGARFRVTLPAYRSPRTRA